MSLSSLWLINEEFNGVVSSDYQNSWWFSPVVWDVLLDKYMHNEIQTPYGYKKSIIGGGAELSNQLNKIINNCDSFSDRICWEITNQQVFFTKNKQKISEAIRKFSKINTAYHINEEDGESFLKLKHITERFNNIANDILAINEELYPYFVFKNTSVDDNVEYWFENYDEETDEYRNKSLKEWNEVVTEFVSIIDGKMNFSTNVEYFNKV